MASKSQKSGKSRGAGKRQAPTVNNAQSGGKPADDDWNEIDDNDTDDAWIEIPVREKDSSRLRRQMEARRKLEQMMEAKRLSRLVDDWGCNDDWYPSEERS